LDVPRLQTPYTDEEGRVQALDDVLVVTPYNAQVRPLRRTVPTGVRAGTVDKFQAQEAPVVCSSAAARSTQGAACTAASAGTCDTPAPRGSRRLLHRPGGLDS